MICSQAFAPSLSLQQTLTACGASKSSTIATLPKELLEKIYQYLLANGDFCRFRLVATTFRAASNCALVRLCPKDLSSNALRAFINLKHLDLRRLERPVTDGELLSLSALKSVEILNVNDAQALSGFGLRTFENFQVLRSLSLVNGWQLTSENLRPILRSTTLRSLDLSRCARIDNKALKLIAHLQQLRELKVGQCRRISPSGLSALKELPRLNSLFLPQSRASNDEGMCILGQLHRLKTLVIGGDSLSRCGLDELRGLAKLEVLGIYQSPRLVDSDLSGFKHLLKLRVLSLTKCKRITHVACLVLEDLPALKILDLSGCNVSVAFCHHFERFSAYGFSIEVTNCVQVTTWTNEQPLAFSRVIGMRNRKASLTAECIDSAAYFSERNRLLRSRAEFCARALQLHQLTSKDCFVLKSIFSLYTYHISSLVVQQWSAFLRDVERLGLGFLRSVHFSLEFDLPLLYHVLGHFPGLFRKYASILSANHYAILSMIEHHEGDIMHLVPEALHAHPGFVFAQFAKSRGGAADALTLPWVLRNDAHFFTKIVSTNGLLIRLAGEAIRSHVPIALKAVSNDLRSMRYLHRHLRGDPAFWTAVAKVHPLALKFAETNPYAHLATTRAISAYYAAPRFGRVASRFQRLARWVE